MIKPGPGAALMAFAATSNPLPDPLDCPENVSLSDEDTPEGFEPVDYDDPLTILIRKEQDHD